MKKFTCAIKSICFIVVLVFYLPNNVLAIGETINPRLILSDNEVTIELLEIKKDALPFSVNYRPKPIMVAGIVYTVSIKNNSSSFIDIVNSSLYIGDIVLTPSSTKITIPPMSTSDNVQLQVLADPYNKSPQQPVLKVFDIIDAINKKKLKSTVVGLAIKYNIDGKSINLFSKKDFFNNQ